MTDFVAIKQALLNLQADITAQQATVQALIDAVNSDKGAALGIATLDANSRLQPAQHPALTSGQIYIGSAGNVPVTESLLNAIASRSTNSANQPLVLDGSGLVSTSNIPSSIVTGASFRGTWNASTNSPTLTSSVGTNGHWYYVGTAGSTTLNGIVSWQKGDIVIFNNGTTAWEKIDGSDAVISVQADGGTAKQGAVSLALTEFNLTTNNALVGVAGKAAAVSELPSSLVPKNIGNSLFFTVLQGASDSFGFIVKHRSINTGASFRAEVFNFVGHAYFHTGSITSPFQTFAIFEVRGESATLLNAGAGWTGVSLTYNTGTDAWTFNNTPSASNINCYFVGIGHNKNRLP